MRKNDVSTEDEVELIVMGKEASSDVVCPAGKACVAVTAQFPDEDKIEKPKFTGQVYLA